MVKTNTLRQDLEKFRNYPMDISSLAGPILWDIIDAFLDQVEHIEKSQVVPNYAVAMYPSNQVPKIFREVWRFLVELTKVGVDTTLLQDVTLVAFAKGIMVSCEDGKVEVTPKIEDALEYLKAFCDNIGKNKSVFIVDSYQPTLNFDKVFGETVDHVVWGQNGDPLRTNLAQLVICDTAHWSSDDFIRDKSLQGRIKSFLERLTRVVRSEKILIVTTNKKMAKIITIWKLPKEIKITWFRSDWMRGVQVEDRRIMVCIGGSYLPKKAYVPESRSFDFEDIVAKSESLTDEEKALRISQILRIDDTRGEFRNAIGRVKDPEGKERSVVFTLGMTIVDVRAMLRQFGPYTVSMPNVIRPFAKGGFMRDALLIASIWLVKMEIYDTHGVLEEFYSYREEIKDLPILVRIIRAVKEKIMSSQKPEVRASEVVPNHTNDVIMTAFRHRDLLEQYNVKIMRKQGGITFAFAGTGLDNFIDD